MLQNTRQETQIKTLETPQTPIKLCSYGIIRCTVSSVDLG